MFADKRILTDEHSQEPRGQKDFNLHENHKTKFTMDPEISGRGITEDAIKDSFRRVDEIVGGDLSPSAEQVLKLIRQDLLNNSGLDDLLLSVTNVNLP